jgi:hypothetical protein
MNLFPCQIACPHPHWCSCSIPQAAVKMSLRQCPLDYLDRLTRSVLFTGTICCVAMILIPAIPMQYTAVRYVAISVSVRVGNCIIDNF